MQPVMLKTMLVSLALLALALPSGAGASPDEEAIQARAMEFSAAWNKHDAKAMAMLWAEDGDLINPFGRTAKGRREIEQLFAEEHATITKGTTYSIQPKWIRMVKPDVAVATWDAVISGIKTADGSAMPPLEHMVTVVVVKRDGKWWTVAARPMIPSPPPIPTPAIEPE